MSSQETCYDERGNEDADSDHFQARIRGEEDVEVDEDGGRRFGLVTLVSNQVDSKNVEIKGMVVLRPELGKRTNRKE